MIAVQIHETLRYTNIVTMLMSPPKIVFNVLYLEVVGGEKKTI